MGAATIRAGVLIFTPIVRHGAAQVEDAVVDHAQVRVIRRRNVESDQAIVNAVEIHFHDNRLPAASVLILVFVVFLGVVGRFLVGLRLVLIPILAFVLVVGLVFVLVLLLAFVLVVGLVFVLVLLLADFIAPRADRVLGILRQGHQINALQVAIDVV